MRLGLEIFPGQGEKKEGPDFFVRGLPKMRISRENYDFKSGEKKPGKRAPLLKGAGPDGPRGGQGGERGSPLRRNSKPLARACQENGKGLFGERAFQDWGPMI
jgi:hypothetical protein